VIAENLLWEYYLNNSKCFLQRLTQKCDDTINTNKCDKYPLKIKHLILNYEFCLLFFPKNSLFSSYLINLGHGKLEKVFPLRKFFHCSLMRRKEIYNINGYNKKNIFLSFSTFFHAFYFAYNFSYNGHI